MYNICQHARISDILREKDILDTHTHTHTAELVLPVRMYKVYDDTHAFLIMDIFRKRVFF